MANKETKTVKTKGMETKTLKPDPKKLTQDGFGLATKVIKLTKYIKESIVYKLSHPLIKFNYILVVSGKNAYGPPGVTVFGSTKEGTVLDNLPILDETSTTPVDALKKLGYVIV